MLALLRTRRWLGYLALVAVFATVSVSLGMWQWNRREEALAAIDRLDRNYDATPEALGDVLVEPDDYRLGQQWTPVEATGSYLADEQLLLRGRVRDGDVGYDVVTPFRTAEGRIVLVDRGWLPPGATAEAPESVPAPPEGEVTIVARLREDEGAISGRGAPAGQIASVDLDVLAASYDAPTYTGAYGLLATEDGVAPSDVAPATRPILDEGPHLSYTLQWFVFAGMGGFAYVWALRREAIALGGEPDGDDDDRRPSPRPARQRRDADADVEDAILEGRSPAR